MTSSHAEYRGRLCSMLRMEHSDLSGRLGIIELFRTDFVVFLQNFADLESWMRKIEAEVARLRCWTLGL